MFKIVVLLLFVAFSWGSPTFNDETNHGVNPNRGGRVHIGTFPHLLGNAGFRGANRGYAINFAPNNRISRNKPNIPFRGKRDIETTRPKFYTVLKCIAFDHAANHGDGHVEDYVDDHVDDHVEDYVDDHVDDHVEDYVDDHVDDHVEDYVDDHVDDHVDDYMDGY